MDVCIAGAGHAIIEATVEDVGFDTTVHPEAIQKLHFAAARLLPPLANAPLIESWAGLRPATEGSLPILGSLPDRPRHIVATGHFRNGILLAPATALLMAQLLGAEDPASDLAPFSHHRVLC